MVAPQMPGIKPAKAQYGALLVTTNHVLRVRPADFECHATGNKTWRVLAKATKSTNSKNGAAKKRTTGTPERLPADEVKTI